MCTNISTFAKLNFILWKNMAIISWKGVFLPNKSKKKKTMGLNKVSFFTADFQSSICWRALYMRERTCGIAWLFPKLYILSSPHAHTPKTHTPKWYYFRVAFSLSYLHVLICLTLKTFCLKKCVIYVLNS